MSVWGLEYGQAEQAGEESKDPCHTALEQYDTGGPLAAQLLTNRGDGCGAGGIEQAEDQQSRSGSRIDR